MFNLIWCKKREAERLTRRLDQAINGEGLRDAQFLRLFANVSQKAQAQGKTISLVGTRANTIREWLSSGWVFFEDGTTELLATLRAAK